MDEQDTDAYLARIGARRPSRPDAAALAELQFRHLLTVPFENLGMHLGETIVLDEAVLLDKVVRRRRGGFCYELNGLFAGLLTALGFSVRLLAAKVFADGHPGPPLDHLTLRVDLDRPWLADVGFGRFMHRPVRLDLHTDQADDGGVFRFADAEDGDVIVSQDGEPQLRVESHPRKLADFEPTCWWQQSWPGSHFLKGPMGSRQTERGRVTVADRTLVLTEGADRTERSLDTDADVLAAYREHLGIELDRVPGR